MSTFFRKSLYENKKIENHNAIMISGMDTFYRESLYEIAHLRKTSVFAVATFYRESLCENKNLHVNDVFHMSTFIENPCTRMKKGGP